jgi:OmpA family
MFIAPTGPGAVVPTDAAGLWNRFINFDGGGAELKLEHMACLDGRVVLLLILDRNRQAWIQGSSSDAWPDSNQWTLADRRAQAVVAYLMSRGLAANQVNVSPSKRGGGQDAGDRAVEVRIVKGAVTGTDPFGAAVDVDPCWIEIDESAVNAVARESATRSGASAAPWSGDVLDYDVNPGTKSVGNQWMMGDASMKSADGAETTSAIVRVDGRVTLEGVAWATAPTVRVKRVRQTAQHTVPIEWQLSGAGTGGARATLRMGHKSLTIQIGGRARLSAWAGPNGNWVEKGGLARAKFAALDDTWGLDDVTFVQTVRIAPGSSDTDAVFWADNFMRETFPGNAKTRDEKCTKWMKDAIQYFHARRIQVFAGYEIVTDGDAAAAAAAKAFKGWLRDKTDDPDKFNQHADKLVGFFDSRELDIDGISYDLEVDGLGDAFRDRIRAMYRSVASRLAKDERYLAFAGPADSSTYADSMREQPYSLGLERNILVRPMSYDSGDAGREHNVAWTLGTLLVHPSHLQVGVGTATTKKPITHEQVTKECATYRSYRVGLIHWHVSDVLDKLDKYADHDKALNPDGPPRGTLGQPMQGPLGPQRIAAFDTAAGAEKKPAKPGA